jgi:hypothetical protein
MSLSPKVTSSRTFDLWITILINEMVPKLVVGISFGDVAVVFGRFVAAQGLERSFGQTIEVNVCAALFQPRTGLEDLKPRQLITGELREPVMKRLVVGCWPTFGRVASPRTRFNRSKLLGETGIIGLWTNWVRKLFAPNIMRFGMTCFGPTAIRVGLTTVPRAMIVRHPGHSFTLRWARFRCGRGHARRPARL